MFVQLIEGRTADPGEVRAALDRWVEDLAPDATGWLGSTAGVAEDGRCVLVARFSDAEAARRNSDRPEQGEWWEATAGHFEGEPTFRETEDVEVVGRGDPDAAGFVQLMSGHSRDPERARELMTADPEALASFRPDLLCQLMLMFPGGEWTGVMYFTSEAEARAGEKQDPPPELIELMEQMAALDDGPPSFLDVREPWLHSPTT